MVLPYTNDDLVVARRLVDAGAAAVMPLGAPIGSGMGIQNHAALRILRERITEVPLIVDAGVGTASDAAVAMELGADGVLMNTAIAEAQDAVLMAEAMRARRRSRAGEAFSPGAFPRSFTPAHPVRWPAWCGKRAASVADAKQRIAFIDWIRGLACIGMFEWHGYDSWLSESARHGKFFRVIQLGGTLPAPIFLFSSGISLALVVGRALQKGATAAQAGRRAIRRGAEIFGFGLLFRVQEFLLGQPRAPWTDLLRVDILNIIGIAIMLMGLCAGPRGALERAGKCPARGAMPRRPAANALRALGRRR